MGPKRDLVGQSLGRLTVIADAGGRPSVSEPHGSLNDVMRRTVRPGVGAYARVLL